MDGLILKNVALPPKIFGAAMFPTVINFMVFAALFFIMLGIGVEPIIVILLLPIFLLFQVALVFLSSKEPHLSNMCQSAGALANVDVREGMPFQSKRVSVADCSPFQQLDVDGATIILKNGGYARVFELLRADEFGAFAEYKDWVDTLGRFNVCARVVTTAERDGTAKIYRTYIVLSVKKGRKSFDKLNDATDVLLSGLKQYRPALVSEQISNGFNQSADKSPLWLFAGLIAPISKPKPLGRGCNTQMLNAFFGSEKMTVDFKTGLVRWTANGREKYAAIVGIKRPGDFMDNQMVGDILDVDADIVVSHNIKPFEKAQAALLLQQQQRLALLGGASANVNEEYTNALHQIEMGQSLIGYALSAFVFGDTPAAVQQAQTKIKAIYAKYNMDAVTESWAALAAYFTLFPSYDVCPRTFLFLSSVVAAALHLGQLTGNLTERNDHA